MTLDPARPSVEPVGTRERQRCAATRVDGQPCRARAGSSGFCIGHSPGAAAARRKGGFGSSKKARADKLLPVRLRPVLDLLEAAIREVHQGSLDHRQGSAMASLANAIVRVFQAGQLEERVGQLEDRILGGSSTGHGSQN